MTDFKKTLGQRIILARKSRGLTQTSLAEKLKVSRQALCNYECGKNSVPAEILTGICSVLNMPLSWLLPCSDGYNNVVNPADIELLIELHKLAPTEIILPFIKQITGNKSHRFTVSALKQ